MTPEEQSLASWQKSFMTYLPGSVSWQRPRQSSSPSRGTPSCSATATFTSSLSRGPFRFKENQILFLTTAWVTILHSQILTTFNKCYTKD